MLSLEILNSLPFKRYEALSDFLAFIGVYDDERRREVWEGTILKYRDAINGGVVVELGAGFGIFSEMALALGAKKVYAVERNPYAYNVLKGRLGRYRNVRVVKKDALKFVPLEEVDVLIHDFYGPLLYDESLYVLDNLPFTPRVVIPNGGRLKMGLLNLEDIGDRTVEEDVLEQLKGVLVADLFEINRRPEVEENTVATWKFGQGLKVEDSINIGEQLGNLLLFYLEVMHNGKVICSSFECTNWPLVWTPRSGDVFSIRFRWGGDFARVDFEWLM